MTAEATGGRGARAETGGLPIFTLAKCKKLLGFHSRFCKASSDWVYGLATHCADERRPFQAGSPSDARSAPKS